MANSSGGQKACIHFTRLRHPPSLVSAAVMGDLDSVLSADIVHVHDLGLTNRLTLVIYIDIYSARKLPGHLASTLIWMYYVYPMLCPATSCVWIQCGS